MMPDIIKDKIDWYIWKHKQREICREYCKRVMLYELYEDMLVLYDKWLYNYRRLLLLRVLIRHDEVYIWNNKGNKVGKLSKNY
jgi:hypothetical protein